MRAETFAEPVAPLMTAPYGEPLRRALAAALAAAKAGDPLAPVTVCMPSAVAGTTVRRQLAADGAGIANVRFMSLPGLAERLAAPLLAASGRQPLLPVVEREAVRGALASVPGGEAGPFDAVADNPATQAALLATFGELRDLDDGALDVLARRSPRAEATVRLHRRHRALVERWVDERGQYAIAATAVGTRRDDAGAVVLYAPRRVRPAEELLLAALARAGRLTVVVGRTGDSATDADTAHALVGQLRPLLGEPQHRRGDPDGGPPTGSMVVRAPDPAEEVRAALRLVAEQLAGGTAPERLAIVTRLHEPYLLLVDEELTAAGVAHHAPPLSTLAQTAAGRALLGLLDLPDANYRRVDVMAWLRGAPVVDPATGDSVPAARWDRLAREAGIAGGPDQWDQRLSRAIVRRAERLASFEPLDGEPVEPDHRLANLEALRHFIAALVSATAAPPSGSWRGLARWAAGLLERYVGRPERIAAWPDGERDAYAAVTDVLRALATLDDVDVAAPPPDAELFRQTVQRELVAPGPCDGRLGRGVIVGRLSDIVGADLDVVVVLGMAEGVFPPRPADDAVVPLYERTEVGMAARGVSRAEERRDYLAALAAASTRVLTFPRADPRAQRERQPARWLLETCAARWGRRAVYSTDLAALRSVAGSTDWFVDIESFEWWYTRGRPPATAHEYDVTSLLAAHRAGLPLTTTAVVAAEPALARGLVASRARQAAGFGPWTGRVGERAEFLAGLEHPQSATAMQTWAACPFRYLLASVLRVADRDEPPDGDEISALDRGSLVHEVLERFVREHIGRPPEQAWTEAERHRLDVIADEVAAEYESDGRTGRPLLWRLHWARLRRYLGRVLSADDELRASLGVSPTAVELGFGFPDADVGPVSVDVGGGRTVVFRGRIDRIDRSASGDRVVVLDYKTAAASSFPALTGEPDDDLTGAGQHLQLLVYAQAARAAYGDQAQIDARFWFVDPRSAPTLRGGVVDERADARFVDVLRIVVDGIEQGLFPARPGAEDAWFGFANCRRCSYNRICPTGRGELWTKVRSDPSLADYVALAEPEPEPEPVGVVAP